MWCWHSQLLKLVEGIYTSKIAADAVDDEVDNERQTSCEFVYDYMLNIYGLKGLAESAVHGVFKKIKKMMISKGIDKCHKVGLYYLLILTILAVGCYSNCMNFLLLKGLYQCSHEKLCEFDIIQLQHVNV